MATKLMNSEDFSEENMRKSKINKNGDELPWNLQKAHFANPSNFPNTLMYQETKGQVCEWTIQVERIPLLVSNFQRKWKKEKAEDVIFTAYSLNELCAYIGININNQRNSMHSTQKQLSGDKYLLNHYDSSEKTV